MDDDAPGFGVSFTIDAGTAYAEAARMAEVWQSAEARVVRAAAGMEKSVAGISFAGAIAEVKTFGLAATRELENAGQAARRAEKNGEALVRQLEKQNSVFGKSREEIRAMRVEEAARAAETAKNTDLAIRLRAELALLVEAEAKAAAGAQRQAQAMREAAAAHDAFEAAARRGMQAYREQQAADAKSAKSSLEARLRNEAAAADLAARQHAQLAAAVRASQAAQEADAVAAERLRASTDPLYAATKRLNAEIAESTRLYRSGATAPAEYARQQEVLAGRMRKLTEEHIGFTGAARRGSGTMTQLSFQLNDIATMGMSGASAFQIFATQAGQIFQVAQMAEGGVKGFGREIGALAMRFLPLAAVAAVAGVALYQWKEQVEKDAGMKAYADTLGLTHKEMKKLGDVSVTTGDLMKGFWKAVNEGGSGKSLMSQLFTDADKKTLQGMLDFTLEVFKGIAAASYGLVVGSYRAAIATWKLFPAALGDIFVTAVNGAIGAVEFLLNKGIAAVNAIAKAGNSMLGRDLFGTVGDAQLGRMQNAYAGAASKLGKAVLGAFNDATGEALKGEALKGMSRIATQSGKFAVESAQERARKKAAEIIADRTPKKPKVDRHAEQLEREAQATEAQIRNLYALAEAYGVSGAAALIAEARVKAESDAIKKRADIEELVSRQVRVAIAERVRDAAKAAATMRDEAAVQAEVNAMVAAGLVPAERANELVKERLADLPLLYAIDAAGQRGLKDEVEKATAALKAQQEARADMKAAEIGTFYTSAAKQAERQLALQREELKLVGATDMERARAMARIQAMQTLQAKGYDVGSEYAKTYIADQVKIAEGAETIRQKQQAWNADLTATSELWDTIDNAAQSAADGMADAFGRFGSAVGDALTIVTGFYADQARLQEQHAKAIRDANGNEAAIARENRLFAIRSSSQQIAAYGNMASAAKGFFKEGSAGYKAMAAAEKVYRVAQLAMSIAAMIQNGVETATSVANSAARATAAGAEGVANQAKLPFPANIAAMAATAAALVAAGIAVFGGGGGSAAAAPKTAEDWQKGQGTGSILGDASAKSESLGKALDLMQRNSNKDLEYSSEMVRALRAIETGISGLAAAVSRQLSAGGGLDASSLQLGTNSSGGLLGSGLFSKKITRELNDAGLQFDGTSVAQAIAGGIEASLYQEVLKTTKKSGFLGIGGSTKTSIETTRTAADAGLTNEVALLIGSMRTAIVEAAGTIGIDGAAAMLDAFQINIGRISFKDLTAEEIESELAAVFSRVGDDMAGAVGGGLSAFQRAGEGMLETLVRLAKEYQTVDVALRSIGMTFGAVGLASVGARTALVDLFGGLDAFTEQTAFFRENFLSEAEQMAPVIAAVKAEMDRLGLAGTTTKDAFKSVVLGLDLSTERGRETYAALMAVAPAFAKTADYLASLNGELKETAKTAEQLAAIEKQRRGLEIQLMEATGNTAGALAAKRADELAAIDPMNRALQQSVWMAQDAAQAARELAAANEEAARAAAAAAEEALRAATAVAQQRRTLEIALMEAKGDGAGALAARQADELAAMDASLRALQQSVWAAEAATAAQNALAEAQAAAAQTAANLAQQRRSMEIELMEALGNVAGAQAARRADEIAGTDASLRALREQIHAAQDAAAANAALAQAQETAAQAARTAADAAAQLARQRAALDIALLRAQGQEAQAVNAERALQLEGTDETLRALQQQVWMAEDARAAAEAAAQAQAALVQQQQQAAQAAEQLRKTRAAMQAELLDAIGDAAGAKALRRLESLAELDPSLRALQELIWRQQDIAEAVSKARDTLTASYEREAAAIGETIERFGGFRDSLRAFRAELGADDGATADAYRAAQARFVDTSALAAMGDAKAMGELEGISKEFLAASRDRASSLEEYQRDVARVAGAVDRAIGASDEAIDYAQLQLEALKRSVDGLIVVNESVVSVHDAVLALRAAMSAAPIAAPAPLPPPPASQAAQPAPIDMDGVERRIETASRQQSVEMAALVERVGKIVRIHERWDAEGAPVRNGEDGPLRVEDVSPAAKVEPA